MTKLTKAKVWTKIDISYWTTNETDWERIVKRISRPLKGELVDGIEVYVNAITLGCKKWWQIWK